MDVNKGAKVLWDFGTAYDLFISQHVLHLPERYNLRANWAAGIRSRISPEQQETLQHVQNCMLIPVHFVYYMKEKFKDSAAVLKTLSEATPLKRLQLISYHPRLAPEYIQILNETTPNRPWTDVERETLLEHTIGVERQANPKYLESLYHIWSDPKAFGEAYLSALKAYVNNFFAEEEKRILPALKQALNYAQMRAGSLTTPKLLEELTAGIRYYDLDSINVVTLAPSFWLAPLMVTHRIETDKYIVVFGARPDNMAIIPGDPVPDSLVRSLKALSDPARLRIMRLVCQSPQTPSQLSRTLRLRLATVTNHLTDLRVAGLLQTTLSEEGERLYATRFDGVDELTDLLRRYLHGI